MDGAREMAYFATEQISTCALGDSDLRQLDRMLSGFGKVTYRGKFVTFGIEEVDLETLIRTVQEERLVKSLEIWATGPRGQLQIRLHRNSPALNDFRVSSATDKDWVLSRRSELIAFFDNRRNLNWVFYHSLFPVSLWIAVSLILLPFVAILLKPFEVWYALPSIGMIFNLAISFFLSLFALGAFSVFVGVPPHAEVRFRGEIQRGRINLRNTLVQIVIGLVVAAIVSLATFMYTMISRS